MTPIFEAPRNEAPIWFRAVVRRGGAVDVEGTRRARFGHSLSPDFDRTDGSIASSWLWNGHELQIESCRFGFHPLFIYVDRNEICLSNRLLAVIRHSSCDQVLDDAAIATFLRIGFFLDNDTPFLGVRHFPPESRAVWAAGAYKVTEMEPHDRGPIGRAASVRVEDYIQLFGEAMGRRRSHLPSVLPLSGGRDSRHILFELISSRRPPQQCLTAEMVPPRSDEDVKVATLLCQHFGLAHETVPQRGSYVRHSRRKNEITSLCCDEHAWAMPLADRLNERPVAIFDGIGGDVMSAGLFSTPTRMSALRARDAAAFADELIDPDDASWRTALSPDALRRFTRTKAVERVISAVHRHLDEPNPLSSFFFWNRTRREVAQYTFAMYRRDTVVHTPYLDHALYDYLRAIPMEDLADKSFHTRAIAFAYPQWAGLPYARADNDPDAVCWPRWRRRLHHARLALDLAIELGRTGAPTLQTTPLLARLPLLVGRSSQDRYWFDIDRILWLCQLNEVARSTRTRAAA